MMKGRNVNAAFFAAMIFSAVLWKAGSLCAQDIHFSQFTQAPLNINPSQAGFIDGFYRGSIHYRNQWPSMGHSFNTMAASFDMPFGIKKRQSAYFGAGVFIYTDKAGDAGLGTTQANLCGSGIVPLSPYTKFAGGINLAFAQQSVHLSSLQFGNQFTNGTYDPNLQSGETVPQSYTFFDAGAGASFQYSNAKGNITRDDILKINFGVAGYHLNMPRQSFYSSSGDRLHPRLVVHGDARIDIPHTKFSVVPSALFMMQGPNMEITAGALCRYRMKNGTKITGAFSEMAISLGVSYRVSDAILPQVLFETGNFAVGFAYDVNVSTYREVSHMNGGFEISLRYVNLLDAIFEKGL